MRLIMTLALLGACGGDTEQTNTNPVCTDDIGAIYYLDADGDGYGVEEGAITSCTELSGYVTDNRDCDDKDPTIHPGVLETCDGVDEDCNGEIDDNAGEFWYTDGDGDGFGNPDTETSECDGSGLVANGDDCDDASASSFPGADELCDGLDHDCDGETMEDDSVDAVTVYLDSDGDKYGDDNVDTTECELPAGYALQAGDCDDSNPAINPGALEVCGGGDEDCDDLVDDADDSLTDALTWYADTDGDGGGDPLSSTEMCYEPTGYVADDGDCYDNDATANGCPLTGSIDLVTDAATIFTGEGGDGLGYSFISGTGDLNGDAIPDLILGAPGIPWVTGQTSGKVAVFYGPVDAGSLDVDSTADVIFTGISTDDLAGFSVVTLDFDHDGTTDIAIGAPGYSTATVGGGVHIIYGTVTPLPSSLDLSNAHLTITGDSAASWFGYSLSADGDLNGDGFDDLVIGAPGDQMNGGSNLEGSAWVLTGGTKATGERSVSTLASAEITGSIASENLGNSVAIIEDQDSDGNDELLVGAPSNHWWGKTIVETGQAFLFMGPPSSTTSTLADARFSSVDAGDYVGVFVGDGGDLDGDGVSDLIIGASGDNDGGTSAGKVGIFFGPVTSGDFDIEDADLTIAGTASFIYTGEGVNSGYFDADNNLDLVISSFGVGAALFYGPLGAGDLLTSAADLSLTPSSSATAVAPGASSYFAEDLDSDGFDDIIITDPTDTAGGTDAGAAYLMPGQID